MMSKNDKKRQIAKISVFITSVFVIFMSVTYAFITQVLTGNKQVVVNAGILDLVLEEENEITISDALPMYDAVGMIQEEVFNFSLINNTSNPTDYTLKLQKVATTNELQPSDVKYYLTKDGVGKPALLSTLSNGVVDVGTISGNDTIEYTLRLWIRDGVTDVTTINGKSLSYKLKLEASQKTQYLAVNQALDLVKEGINLGEKCKLYDDGVDTFLVGECSNNYVWYSGKLWRVVLKNNETGAVKIVTDNAITAIPYNASGNSAFKDSYIDQWLNQEFLPTLHNYEDYLVVDSVWDATENSSSIPSRPSYTTSVTRTVGLLNIYEYYTTHNNSGGLASSSTGYLKNGVYWGSMTPYSPSNVRIVRGNGGLDYNHSTNSYGARPSVNLKSTIQISGGTGIHSDPYILEGDIEEPVNGTTLLNTRYSGEYITFNNELYRIVNIENGLTKITVVDKPSSLLNNAFNSNSSINFANASIKTDLENYYQGLKIANETAYNMIEPSTTWYLGTVGSGVNYKASICANIDVTKSMNACTDKATSTTASIGLPRVGEMFTSQITRGTKANFWTLTPYDMSNVLNVGYDSVGINNPYRGYGARPSMYLKSGIKIASSNTGNGTFEKPYSIELGQ